MMFGSVCSGIEAATVAWHELGWRAAWLAEIDKFASALLAHHYPSVPNLGDMTKIARAILTGEVPAPDVLCGGTPCQAFSVAGLRESLADARGNLTLKFVEIANAIDHVRAGRGDDECIVFWENVPGVLSTKDNAFGCFLAGLAGEDEPLVPPGQAPKPGQPWKWSNAGAVYGPRRAVAWRTLDAQYFGVAQRRRRVFVVASARKGFDPAQVLFEWDGLRRDTAPSREARQTAPTIPSRSTAGGGLGTDFDCDGGLIAGTLQAGGKAAGSATQQDAESGLLLPVAYGGNNQSGPIDVATARNACASASASGRMDFETETFLVQPTHTLRGEGFDASEDGTGRGTPLVPVAFDTTQITSAANRSNPQPGDACHPLAAGAHAPAIAFQANLSGTQCVSTEELAPSMGAANPTAVAVGADCFNGSLTGDIAATMGTRGSSETASGPTLLHAMQVRRLTPTECERLQGFPDGYTAIPWRGKPADQCPDGPRYKALGNSWAVPNVTWLGRRIQAALRNS
ncbi:DNA methyltransferase [Acidovorax sp. HMWF018]|uniref:DNA cytosine methyltransferase n=1 Tax=Acidovorax sp. HMWF018 TaxID=2056855 RepID=UPI000D335A20|nr:DNA cytosine methyltransferase [Acidovorax sp. HMWF018]PTT41478.1 DNA methyltransferase [Acidovorax sp. HMWF018]